MEPHVGAQRLVSDSADLVLWTDTSTVGTGLGKTMTSGLGIWEQD